MPRAPGLVPRRSAGVLVDDRERQVRPVLVLQVLSEKGVEVGSGHDDHVSDPRCQGVPDGEVEKGLAVGADVDELLVAAEPRTQPTGHHEERDVVGGHADGASPPRSPCRKASRAVSPIPRRFNS